MRNTISIKRLRSQGGFTLVELIMVIVILGVLSAFALPKFANITDDAKRAAVQGAKAAVSSASGIVHAAWLAKGSTGTTITLDGGLVVNTTAGGFPLATFGTTGLTIGITQAAGIDCLNEFDCRIGDGTPTPNTSIIITKKGQATSTTTGSCFVYSQLTGVATTVLNNFDTAAPSCL